MSPHALRNGRSRIDDIDVQLLRLLNRRTQLARKLGEVKLKLGLPIYDGVREREILQRLRGRNQGPLGEAAIENIFRCIIRESRRAERTLSVKAVSKMALSRVTRKLGNGAVS